jgi:hypothetical protein
MSGRSLRTWLSGALLLMVGGRVAMSAPTDQITILYDAFGKPGPMRKDWGYAALV